MKMAANQRKKELIEGHLASLRGFQFCGPSDDPDEQTAVTEAVRDLVCWFDLIGNVAVFVFLHPELHIRQTTDTENLATPVRLALVRNRCSRSRTAHFACIRPRLSA
jgi:hypothetical protein